MLKNFFPKKGKIIDILYHFFQNILSPKHCLSCFNYNQNYLCKECLIKLRFDLGFSCLECGRRVITKCQINHHSHLIKFLISFGDYENRLLSNLILMGKKDFFEIFIDFGIFIAEFLKNNLSQIDGNNQRLNEFYLTPIPLTKKKLLERGFNQAEILAKTISQETGIKIFNGLIKTKETKDQAELSYEERLVNLKDVFSLKETPVPKKLILVDDVKTTGATIKEAAKVLKKAGAKKIIALTILK